MQCRRWLTGILCVAGLLALPVMLSAVVGSVRYLRVGPGFDYWTDAMPFLQSAVDGPWHWPLLWQITAGAHCLVLPRLLFLLEWYVGYFQNGVMLFSAWACLMGSALLILRAVWQESTLDIYSKWLCVFLVCMGLFSAQHMNNLAYSFNIQWPLSLFLSLLFISLMVTPLVSTDKKNRFVYCALAILVAGLLVISNFTLPALFCCCVVLAWRLRIRWRWVLLILLCLALVSVYYISFLPVTQSVPQIWLAVKNGDISVLDFLKGLLVLLYFSVLYLASPISEVSRLAGVIFSITVLFFCAYQLWWKKNASENNKNSLLFWMMVGYTVFVCAMAFSTALGRALSFDSAVSPRFRTTVMPFLTLAAILWVCRMQVWPSVARVVGSLLLVVLTAVVVMPGHARLLYQFSDEYDQYSTPVIAMAVGLTHINVVHQARIAAFWQVDNQQMLKYRDFMRQHHRGIYATDVVKQLGTYLVVSETHSTQNSTKDLRALPGGGFQWQGYTDQCGSDGLIAVVNAQGEVIGSGAVKRKLPNDSLSTLYTSLFPLCRAGEPALWTAFLPMTARAGDAVSAVVFSQESPVVIAQTVLP